MNQPKFKFGDKVIRSRGILPSEPFIVGAINFAHGTYFYGEDGDESKMYCDVVAYQEPKKTKLYAYKSEHGDEIKFCIDEDRRWIGHCSERYFRCNVYDIRVPS